jgi:hypothetical protein
MRICSGGEDICKIAGGSGIISSGLWSGVCREATDVEDWGGGGG